MQIKANTPEEYIAQLPEERKQLISKLRRLINENLPEGFKEEMNYGMIGWVVPHSIYPAGYHTDPKQPLQFINLASQKNHIAVYHMGVYANPELLKWFTEEYPKHCKRKLDMGKSCIRFKKIEEIPYELIGELVTKVSLDEWVGIYEKNFKN
ncbi:MAG: DUF1801 domain-containing protein [Saprospiraceae bacterium]|nr:DUF1801 domain-containing protein [Saprospiraceae bacterium]